MLVKKNEESILDIRKFESECLNCSCCRYNGICHMTEVVGSKKTIQDFCMITREYGKFYFTRNKLKTRYLVIKYD